MVYCVKITRQLRSLFFQAEDGIRDLTVTGVQTCALPISTRRKPIAVSVCRSSCTKVSRPSPSRTRARCGRRRRALTDGLTRQGQDEKIVLPLQIGRASCRERV